MKRLISLCAAIALLFCMLPGAAALETAAGGTNGLQVDWYPEYQTVTRLFGLDRISLKQNNLFGLFTLEGESITGCVYDAIDQPMKNGTMVAMKGGKWGVIDKDGNVVRNFIYSTKEEAKGPVNVKIVQKGGLFAIADQKGKLLTGYDYWNGKSFSNGYAAIQNKQGLWGYIDGNGNVAVPFCYEADAAGMGDMNEDGFAVIQSIGGWRVVDTRGEEVFKNQQGKIWSAGHGMWGFTVMGKIGFANSRGEIVVAPQYVYYTNPKGILYGGSFDENGIAKVYTAYGDGAEKRIDTTGAEVSAGTSFAHPLSEGLSRKEENGKWGFVGIDGKWVIPALYDGVSDFDCGYASVLARGVYGMLKHPLICSDWAKEELTAAEAGGYVTSRTKFYRQDEITRLQFAELAVNYYEKMTGTAVQAAPAETFTDTTDEAVLKAYAAGIVDGRGEGIFDPEGILTRQELATMLYRAMVKAGVEFTAGEADLNTFADGDQVHSWARQAMENLVGAGVLKGTGAGLAPLAKCTVEQGILQIWRAVR